MIWLVGRLRRDFRTWDRATKLAFGVGLILLMMALVALVAAPAESRFNILIGVAALLIVIEVAVLWGNRGMTSAYTQAQRLYLSEDFEGARDVLESVRSRADARVLTLLGNTYRQLGQLDQSAAVLSEAVDKAPNHYFPLYGFGRTLLSEGRYDEAAALIRRAIDANAPQVIRADLGEAYFRLGMAQDAVTALRDVTTDEPHRALMIRYLLFRLGEAPPPSAELVEAGLPYWQATAERFRHTPYGVSLARDVREMLNEGT